MIFIFIPSICIYLLWLYIFKFSILFSCILIPLTYIFINILLYVNNTFTYSHSLLTNIAACVYIENQIKHITISGFNLILKIPIINKLYLQLKVRILMYVIQIIITFIPNKTENDFNLTTELQSDYLDILQRHKIKIN